MAAPDFDCSDLRLWRAINTSISIIVSPGALDFEMEKNSRKLIFSGKLLEGA